MRTRIALTAAAVLAAGLVQADTDVRRNGDKVDVHAATAPISEVLDRLAKQTGMKVIYDGPQPRARVRLDLTAVTPMQAVLSLLEGQGLNYALRMDASGTRIDTLLLVASGGGASAPVSAAPPRPDVQRLFEREQPEPPEPEEAPSEVPGQGNADDIRSTIPGMPIAPNGPAMPLTLPTPPPVGSDAGRTPGVPSGLILPPALAPGVVPSPAPGTPQD